MNGPVNVPTVDELIADPSKVKSLPPEVRKSIWLNVWNLEKVLALEIITGSHQGGKTPPPDDVLIGVEEVAHLIGTSNSWVEKHTDNLPPRRSVEGNPRWLKSEVLAWVKTRPVYGQG